MSCVHFVPLPLKLPPNFQTGDGDLEEMVEELNPGKVLYAYW